MHQSQFERHQLFNQLATCADSATLALCHLHDWLYTLPGKNHKWPIVKLMRRASLKYNQPKCYGATWKQISSGDVYLYMFNED